jgi:hypothetical protein
VVHGADPTKCGVVDAQPLMYIHCPVRRDHSCRVGSRTRCSIQVGAGEVSGTLENPFSLIPDSGSFGLLRTKTEASAVGYQIIKEEAKADA